MWLPTSRIMVSQLQNLDFLCHNLCHNLKSLCDDDEIFRSLPGIGIAWVFASCVRMCPATASTRRSVCRAWLRVGILNDLNGKWKIQ